MISTLYLLHDGHNDKSQISSHAACKLFLAEKDSVFVHSEAADILALTRSADKLTDTQPHTHWPHRTNERASETDTDMLSTGNKYIQ